MTIEIREPEAEVEDEGVVEREEGRGVRKHLC